ncbi:MAG: cadherin-like beta sandwich domain-containing protein [Chloroflexi bacterium]|nr:cadherin-like beta sandwich domain-containing protein [Chloroflexota bacterium]
MGLPQLPQTGPLGAEPRTYSPRGIWSDGEVMYVVDESDGRIYTYNMPDAIDARLASLSLSGVEIGTFSPTVTSYRGVVEEVATTTVSAPAAQRRTTVAIEPADADPARRGHQVALQGLEAITVTVTSADRSRTRVYRVAFREEPRPAAACLLGAVGEGFSLVVHSGGSLEELESCARDRSVAALYALREGAYVPYFPGAPAFVNRPFAELFRAGVPATTPLVVAGTGPPSASPALEIDDAEPSWSECLLGSNASGYSAAVFEGGSIEDLAACALGRGVAALYALHSGDWVSYTPGAPGFANRAFHELFPAGLPPATPLVVTTDVPSPAAPAEEAVDESRDDSPEGTGSADNTATNAEAEAEEQRSVLVVGNTGGDGVSHRNDCADNARLPRFGWEDGTEVEVVAEGAGRCAGWLRVRADDGVMSWVREQFLRPV